MAPLLGLFFSKNWIRGMRKYHITLIISSLLIGGQGRILTADLENSNLRWLAEKVTGSHWGNVSLKKGVVEFKDDRLISGEFIVDMTSIKVMDIKDSPWGDKLEAHLHAGDFFDTEKYPEAYFFLNSALIKNNKIIINGDMTIKDKKHPIEFNCEIIHSDGLASAKGQMKIDRTLYDITYRSAEYYPDIGDRMIDDIFTIDFEIETK